MKLAEMMLDCLFPDLCLGCHKPLQEGNAICDHCASEIPLESKFFCGRCNRESHVSFMSCHPDAWTWGSAWRYDNERAAALVKKLKFGGCQRAARALAAGLARFMLQSAPASTWQSFHIVPMPLGARRLRERGFNQADLLAHALAAELSLVCLPGLRRILETKPQTSLSAKMRRENVRKCFSACPEIAGTHILLIDDVTTTGATLAEAATALAAGGAARIVAITVAKTT